jgi:hypothetical protein
LNRGQPLVADPGFPLSRKAVRGKFFDRNSKGTGQVISSWPDLIDLTRPSTPSGARNKDVDTRDKPAQDDRKSFPASRIQVFLAAISPDSLRFRGNNE